MIIVEPRGDIGGTIKFLRKVSRLTQQELANNSGVSRVHITEIETHKTFPRYCLVERLLKYMGYKLIIVKEDNF